MTTYHKAKGLEWDRVYLMSVNNYDFPSGDAHDSFIAERWFVRDGLNLQEEALAQLTDLMVPDRPYDEGERHHRGPPRLRGRAPAAALRGHHPRQARAGRSPRTPAGPTSGPCRRCLSSPLRTYCGRERHRRKPAAAMTSLLLLMGGAHDHCQDRRRRPHRRCRRGCWAVWAWSRAPSCVSSGQGRHGPVPRCARCPPRLRGGDRLLQPGLRGVHPPVLARPARRHGIGRSFKRSSRSCAPSPAWNASPLAASASPSPIPASPTC